MAVWIYSVYVYGTTFYNSLLNSCSLSLIELFCALGEEGERGD